MPPHESKLKLGMPIMTLRNLNQAGRQATGTILMIQHISNHILQAPIMNGNQKGEEARISSSSSYAASVLLLRSISHSQRLCQASWLIFLWLKLLLHRYHQSHALVILQIGAATRTQPGRTAEQPASPPPESAKGGVQCLPYTGTHLPSKGGTSAKSRQE
ncbi:TPA: hypothetical protein ACH3X2_012445 [Trebouxia sp. C0005]